MVLLGGLAGCSKNANEVSISSTTNTEQSISRTSGTAESSSATDSALKVSVKDAISLYQQTYPNTDISSIDLEYSFGKYSYQIEGLDDQTEYGVLINGETQEVSKDREESLDTEEQNGVKRSEEKLDLENILSIEEVASIAEKHAGSGKAIEWSLDQDMGITYWEVTVSEGNNDVDVKIDAKSGKLLESENDD